MGKRPTDNSEGGIVVPGQVMTIRAAQRSLCIGPWAWREFAKSLPNFKIGRVGYVLSDDVIEACRHRRDEQVAKREDR